MKIISIETSCDETAISVLQAKGSLTKPSFEVLGNKVASQIALHAQFGGVFPAMAKREHAKNIFPLFIKVLKQAKMYKKNSSKKDIAIDKKIKKILEREPEVFTYFEKEMKRLVRPKIDAIAVTYGPGLEPALWVGISFAKALAAFWDIPVVPVNHMEGHILSVLIQGNSKNKYFTPQITMPAVALLVSGGHTELLQIKNWMSYKMLGQTRDDAAGEAYDKVARMLGLPYPGGPEISKLAEIARTRLTIGKTTIPCPGKKSPDRRLLAFPIAGDTDFSIKIVLPRPMLNSNDFDFSFSGLKTAVLYMLRDMGKISEETKMTVAREFEDAVTDVLVKKTFKAVEKTKAKSIVVGGGVSANKHLKRTLQEEAKKLEIQIHFPEKELSTDNSLMIGIAGYLRYLVSGRKTKNPMLIKARGNLSF